MTAICGKLKRNVTKLKNDKTKLRKKNVQILSIEPVQNIVKINVAFILGARKKSCSEQKYLE